MLHWVFCTDFGCVWKATTALLGVSLVNYSCLLRAVAFVGHFVALMWRCLFGGGGCAWWTLGKLHQFGRMLNWNAWWCGVRQEIVARCDTRNGFACCIWVGTYRIKKKIRLRFAVKIRAGLIFACNVRAFLHAFVVRVWVEKSICACVATKSIFVYVCCVSVGELSFASICVIFVGSLCLRLLRECGWYFFPAFL